MLVTVLKAFPFSTDGLNSQTALPGEREIPAALVPGLIADGYVCPEGHEPVAMTPHRRKAIVDRVTDLFRAHMEALTDEQLLQTAASAERQTQAAADGHAEGQPIPHSDAHDDRAEPVEGIAPDVARSAEPETAPALIPGAEINDGVQRPLLGEPSGEPVLGVSDVVIDIPPDWQALHHKTRVALAKKLKDGSGNYIWAPGIDATPDDADRIIAGEVKRRAAAEQGA